jgi:hypothetical protein
MGIGICNPKHSIERLSSPSQRTESHSNGKGQQAVSIDNGSMESEFLTLENAIESTSSRSQQTESHSNGKGQQHVLIENRSMESEKTSKAKNFDKSGKPMNKESIVNDKFFDGANTMKMMTNKSMIRDDVARDIANFLRNGGSITTVKSRVRRRYRNPVPLSGITQARTQINSRRRAHANVVANLFPSSVDPSVARAVIRGSLMRRRRVYSSRVPQQI